MVHTKIKLNTSFKKTINFKQEFFGSRPKIKISKKSLTKSWIAGFIDGDGSFNLEKVDFSKSKNPSNTFFFRPILSISQNDPQLLHKIRDYFGCGKVTRKSEKAWHYRCRNAKDFKNFIIPRLQNAPFQTIKQYEFDLLCNEAMPLFDPKNGIEENIKNQKFLEILNNIRANRNNLTYKNDNPITWDWFLGFFEAEGNFSLTVTLPDETQEKNKIRIGFKVSQKNKNILIKIQDFWKFGNVSSEGFSRNMWKYYMDGIKDVCKYATFIFGNHPLKGKKNLERVKFLKAIRIIMKQNTYITEYSPETMNRLKKLAEGIHLLRNN